MPETNKNPDSRYVKNPINLQIDDYETLDAVRSSANAFVSRMMQYDIKSGIHHIDPKGNSTMPETNKNPDGYRDTKISINLQFDDAYETLLDIIRNDSSAKELTKDRFPDLAHEILLSLAEASVEESTPYGIQYDPSASESAILAVLEEKRNANSRSIRTPAGNTYHLPDTISEPPLTLTLDYGHAYGAVLDALSNASSVEPLSEPTFKWVAIILLKALNRLGTSNDGRP